MLTQTEGELGGSVKEYDWNNELRYHGSYVDGVRHGKGELHLIGGGRICGVWVEGELIETRHDVM